ncbi:MAG: retropepsin-like aspartic protease [Candidatus Acidiferrales bacterium]
MLALFLTTIAASAGPLDLELPFQLDSRYDAILIQAEVNGKSVRLLVDTGASQTILDAQLLGLTNLDLKISRFSSSGPGLRGEAVWAQARLKLGARTWHEQRVVAMNLEQLASRYGQPVHGLLGQDILRQFARVTIDFRTRTLILVSSVTEPANANESPRKK